MSNFVLAVIGPVSFIVLLVSIVVSWMIFIQVFMFLSSEKHREEWRRFFLDWLNGKK